MPKLTSLASVRNYKCKSILATSVLAAAAFSVHSSTARAGVLYWDPDGSTIENDLATGAGLGGAGSWTTATPGRWWDGVAASADVGWVEDSDAIFWGTAGVVAPSGPRRAGSLTFKTTGYQISGLLGNTITLSGATPTLHADAGVTGEIFQTLAGSNGWTKTGAGTISLRLNPNGAATSTLQGPIFINEGTVQTDSTNRIGTGTGLITISNGATLKSTDTTITNSFISANHGIAIGTGGGTLDVANTIYAGTITGVGGTTSTGGANTLTKSGPGELRYQGAGTANTTFAKLNVTGGLFRLGNVTNNNFETGFGAAPTEFLSDAITLSNGATIGTSYGVTLHANRGITLGPGGGGFFLSAGNMTVPGAISGTGPMLKNTTGQLTLNGTNTYTGGTSWGAGTIIPNTDSAFGTGDVTITPTNAVSLLRNGTSVTTTLANNIVINAGTNVPDITATSTNTLNLSGVISGAGNWNRGAGSSGAGFVILGGTSPNTYTGNVIVSTGSLVAAKDAAFGDVSGTTTVSGTGSVGFQGNVNYTTLEPLSIAGNGSSSTGAIRNVSGDNTFAGPVTLTANANIGSAAGTLTLSGPIGGDFQVTKVGVGAVSLSGNNAYTGGTVVNAGTLNVNSSTALGSSTAPLTVSNTNTGASATDVVVNVNTSQTVGGLSGTISTPQAGTNTATINVNGTATFLTVNQSTDASYAGSVAGTGSFVKEGAAALTVGNVRTASAAVNSGALRIAPSAGDKGTSVLASMPTVADNATFDLNDSKMIVQFGTNALTLASVRDAIVKGRGGTDFGNATWQGTGGIASSAAAVGGLGDGTNNADGISYAVGYVENSYLPNLGLPSYTEFGGQTVDSGSLLVRFTKGADANLDGKVNTDDVTIVGALYGNVSSGEWFYGDFDYDGIVDTDDVTVLGALYDATAPALSQSQLATSYGSEFAAAFIRGQAMSAVPEPASLSVIGVGALALLKRRRRR